MCHILCLGKVYRGEQICTIELCVVGQGEKRRGEEGRGGGREISFDLYHLPARNLANQTATTGSDRLFGKHG
jgi:hypothetical protein